MEHLNTISYVADPSRSEMTSHRAVYIDSNFLSETSQIVHQTTSNCIEIATDLSGFGANLTFPEGAVSNLNTYSVESEFRTGWIGYIGYIYIYIFISSIVYYHFCGFHLFSFNNFNIFY